MSEQRSRSPVVQRAGREFLETGCHARRRATQLCGEFQHISDALIASGYTTLDKQARALGIHRATAWTIVKRKHKLGRLSAKTTKRILANPDTPPAVRAIVVKYLAERSEVFGAPQPKEEQTVHRADYKN